MRWLNGLFVMVVMAGSTSLWAAGGVLPGSGTEGDPYLIEDVADFDAFADSENAPTYWATGVHTKLACDPNMAGRPYVTAVIAPDTPDTGDYFDGTPFEGVFDGDGHVIRNLTIDTLGAGNDYIGLFGVIEGSSAEVKNLGMENINIASGDGSGYLGGLCGYNNRGTMSNCYAAGSVSGGDGSGYLGALCGYNRYGTISNCYSGGSVNSGDGSYSLGGLCGYNRYGTISNCYATGSVSGGDDSELLGALCGGNGSFGSITNCYAAGSVSGGDDSGLLGGLCGRNMGTITNCYATGSITGGSGSYWLGGLCGDNRAGTITNCYATGLVTGWHQVGGLVGRNASGTISNCYVTGSVSGGTGSYNLGGLCGYNYDGTISTSYWDMETSGMTTSDGGTGLLTAQMQTLSTFVDAGWDLTNIWNIGENQTYPYLRTYSAADINKDRAVNLIDLSIMGEQWMRQ